jgi:glycosyltransferase involved in cell wall biosynthesis
MRAEHILVVPSWYSTGRGAGGGYFRDQALALQAAGRRVAILAPDIYTTRDLRRGKAPSGRRAVAVEADGVAVYRRSRFVAAPRLPYRNALAWTLCGLRSGRHYIAENGAPDLIHAHGCLNAGVLAAALGARHAIPFVLSEHSPGFAQSRLRWWERDLVRRVIRRAHRCTAVSPHLVALLQAQYPGSRWAYLPNVLGEDFLGASGAAPPTVGGPTPFVFVCVARMSPEKGHGPLIEAFAAAFGGDPEVRLRLVGDGPARPMIEALGARLGVERQIELVGALPPEAVPEALVSADAFVLASPLETFGVAVIEALASGLPVVCTASGGPDHLIDPSNGLLTAVGDGAGLRDALRRMRRRAAEYDRATIRADAIRRFGPDAFARRFQEILA